MHKSTRIYLVAALLVVACAVSTSKLFWFAPTVTARSIELESIIPGAFGDWVWLPAGLGGVVNPQQDALSRRIYSQTLTRLYRHVKTDQVMMLSVVYGADQRDDLQVHYPEVCYPAQGFQVSSNIKTSIPTSWGALAVRRMETRLNADRSEPVTYWAMLGEHVVLGGMQKKMTEIRMSWSGRRADGLLFRVSSIDELSQRAFSSQTSFITDLLGVLPADVRHRLSGL